MISRCGSVRFGHAHGLSTRAVRAGYGVSTGAVRAGCTENVHLALAIPG